MYQVAAAAGVGIAYAFYTAVKGLLGDAPEIDYIWNERDCNRAIERILREMWNTPVLGLDCEWNPTERDNGALILSLATPKRYCAVIQLCSLKNFPKNLKVLLERKDIFKVGVGIKTDQQQLRKCGLFLNGWVDLRHLNDEIKYPPKMNNSSKSLKGLTQRVLGEDLNKDMQTDGNWDKQLTSKQIRYAAMDADVGNRICRTLVNYKYPDSPMRRIQLLQKYSATPYPIPNHAGSTQYISW